MKKSLVIFFGSLLFFISGYFIYAVWDHKSSADLWDFVPENSGLVYESNDLGATLLRLQGLESFQSLISLSLIHI